MRHYVKERPLDSEAVSGSDQRIPDSWLVVLDRALCPQVAFHAVEIQLHNPAILKRSGSPRE
jgi:hypothetical protein